MDKKLKLQDEVFSLFFSQRVWPRGDKNEKSLVKIDVLVKVKKGGQSPTSNSNATRGTFYV